MCFCLYFIYAFCSLFITYFFFTDNAKIYSLILFYFYRFLRAHLLTAKAPDTFSVIIDRRLFLTFPEIYRFPRNRAAFDANAAATEFFRFYLRLLLEYL